MEFIKNNKVIIGVIVLILGVVSLPVFFRDSASNQAVQGARDGQTLRIGWQVAWVPQAQLAVTMQNTDILEQNNINAEFISFTAGGPLIEAARASELDIFPVGDFPAQVLIDKDPNWTIISRAIDTNVSLIVPPDSDYQTMQDLRGQTICLPFNSGPHMHFVKTAAQQGIDAQEDFNIKNVGPLDIGTLVDSGKWDDCAGAVVWDPTLSRLLDKNKARSINRISNYTVFMASKDLVDNQPQIIQDFVNAQTESYFYYAQNQDEVNQWTADTINFQEGVELLAKTGQIEPNLTSRSISEIDIQITDQDIEDMQQIIDLASQNDLIENYNIERYINTSFVEEAKTKYE